MKVNNCCGVLLAAGLICGVGTDLPRGPGPGLASAAVGQARIYTRKRVHGRWVTGRFSDRAEARGRRTAEVAPVRPPSPPLPERFAALQTNASGSQVEADPAQEGARRDLLQRALESRAQQIALMQPAPRPEPGVQPRSVSFDFESGLKTTTFPDARIVREGFDVAAARALASPPPDPTVIARPAP